ncbi:MAG TPA: hypothetical protein VE078_18335, partial [Thermoanaerobaculia bacterium]|nr:hypothetical protein [Thermoanaerobaculia bacterium]
MSSLSRMVIALALAGAGFMAGLAWPSLAVDEVPSSALAPAAQTQVAAQGQGRPAAVPRPELAEEERATIGLFERASPSVVYITSLALQR